MEVLFYKIVVAINNMLPTIVSLVAVATGFIFS